MKLELTEQQAQTVITSQLQQIAALKTRLRTAHVHSKYLTRDSANLPLTAIQATIAHLKELIDSDQPNGSDDWGFVPLYDHEAMEQTIATYETLLNDPRWHSMARVPVLSYEYQFATNGNDDRAARNVVSHLQSLQGQLRKVGEPDTPDFFSSQTDKEL